MGSFGFDDGEELLELNRRWTVLELRNEVFLHWQNCTTPPPLLDIVFDAMMDALAILLRLIFEFVVLTESGVMAK